MIASAALLIREHGARATSIDDVLAHSGAPRGSVYHHFPGGREELVEEATAFAGEFVDARLRAAREGAEPLAAFDEFLAGYRRDLIASGFRVGCPVAAVAIEAREDGDPITDRAGSVFEGWTTGLAAAFADAGMAKQRAAELAEFAIAAAEGAIVISRARRSIEPFDRARAELTALLRSETSEP